MDRKERLSPRFVRDSTGEVREKGVGVRKCPVCGEMLVPGAMVKSKVFQRKGGDQMMQVFGCPYCWPDNTEYRRICPVCEKVIPRDGYLVARYFSGPNRRHVHVLGCSGCRRG
jgi:predicted nucleic acid-binding Zn ribbon protein